MFQNNRTQTSYLITTENLFSQLEKSRPSQKNPLFVEEGCSIQQSTKIQESKSNFSQSDMSDDLCYYDANCYLTDNKQIKQTIELDQSVEEVYQEDNAEKAIICQKKNESRRKLKKRHTKRRKRNQRRPHYLCSQSGPQKRENLLVFKAMMKQELALRLCRDSFCKMRAELHNIKDAFEVVNCNQDSYYHNKKLQLLDLIVAAWKKFKTYNVTIEEHQHHAFDKIKLKEQKFNHVLPNFLLESITKKLFADGTLLSVPDPTFDQNRNIKVLNVIQLLKIKDLYQTYGLLKDVEKKYLIKSLQTKYEHLNCSYEARLNKKNDKISVLKNRIEKLDFENMALNLKRSQDYFCEVKITREAATQTDLTSSCLRTDQDCSLLEFVYSEYFMLKATLKNRKTSEFNKQMLDRQAQIKNLEKQIMELKLNVNKVRNRNIALDKTLLSECRRSSDAEKMLQINRKKYEELKQKKNKAILINNDLKHWEQLHVEILSKLKDEHKRIVSDYAQRNCLIPYTAFLYDDLSPDKTSDRKK